MTGKLKAALSRISTFNGCEEGKYVFKRDSFWFIVEGKLDRIDSLYRVSAVYFMHERVLLDSQFGFFLFTHNDKVFRLQDCVVPKRTSIHSLQELPVNRCLEG